MSMILTIGTACDNNDRLGNVNIAFVPRGLQSYDADSVARVEISRFITRFMNRNTPPDTIRVHCTASMITTVLRNESIRDSYDLWMELELFGVPYAANIEVTGCVGNDVFYGSRVFGMEAPVPVVIGKVIVPVTVGKILNNYDRNAADAMVKTQLTQTFMLDKDLKDAALFLITPSYGANQVGEGYNRQDHFVYLDGQEVLQYKPGGITFEPLRKYNTRQNGIYYGSNPVHAAQCEHTSTRCRGCVVPVRRVNLGTLSAGAHTFRITVPDAKFLNGEGYIPVSLYLQGVTSGQLAVNGRQSGSVRRVSDFPSQVAGMLYTSVPAGKEITRIAVYAMDGRCVLEMPAERVDVSRLPDGIYAVHLHFANTASVIQMVHINSLRD